MESDNIENVLQYINKEFITLADGDITETNKILSKVLVEITNALKSVNPLFKYLFKTYIYGGSSYDGLKVSKPDEFDIDLKLFLKENVIQIEPSDKDGFVYVKLKNWEALISDANLKPILGHLEKLIDDENYLSQKKVKQWMQGMVDKAINKIKEDGSLDKIEIKSSVNGPAIKLTVTHESNKMDIDLVAVFRILGEQWPAFPVRQNSTTISDFIVVPKPPKNVTSNEERYWRLSFPEQEKELIKGMNFCKPAIRLLKKIRDTHTHNIPSYFIKTVFLWEIEKRKENNETAFWNSSLTNVFLEMLEVYKNYLEDHVIPYYWNKNHNFLEHLEYDNIDKIKNRIDRIVKDIDKKKDSNPLIVAEFILPAHEFSQVKSHFSRNMSVSYPEPEDVSVREPIYDFGLQTEQTEDIWMREPIYESGLQTEQTSGISMREPRYDSGLQTEQTSGIATREKWVGAAVLGIGAVMAGMFIYARSQRNNNN